MSVKLTTAPDQLTTLLEASLVVEMKQNRINVLTDHRTKLLKHLDRAISTFECECAIPDGGVVNFTREKLQEILSMVEYAGEMDSTLWTKYRKFSYQLEELINGLPF